MRSGELHALLFSDYDEEAGIIHVERSYSSRIRGTKSTKKDYWRDVPVNPELADLLKTLKATANGREHILPRFQEWDRGEAARVLRTFCEGVGIPSVKLHTLRACFATQLIRAKQPPITVMKICGWKELKTMQGYIRLAGIEIEGATNALSYVSPSDAMGKVVELFKA